MFSENIIVIEIILFKLISLVLVEWGCFFLKIIAIILNNDTLFQVLRDITALRIKMLEYSNTNRN